VQTVLGSTAIAGADPRDPVAHTIVRFMVAATVALIVGAVRVRRRHGPD
jgi:hypothetical protein